MQHFKWGQHSLQLVHLTSGRARLKAIAPTETVLKTLAKQFEKLEGVYEIECKITTGSLIIWFNEYHLTSAEFKEFLTRSPDLSLPLTNPPLCLPETQKNFSNNPLETPEEVTKSGGRGIVRIGVLRGLKGGVLKCCLAIFARYSLSELAEHSQRTQIPQTSLPQKSVWQRLKAIAS